MLYKTFLVFTVSINFLVSFDCYLTYQTTDIPKTVTKGATSTMVHRKSTTKIKDDCLKAWEKADCSGKGMQLLRVCSQYRCHIMQKYYYCCQYLYEYLQKNKGSPYHYQWEKDYDICCNYQSGCSRMCREAHFNNKDEYDFTKKPTVTTLPTTTPRPTIKEVTEAVFLKQSGSFSSLNYPNNYPTHVDFTYKIQLNNSKRVCLHISDLKLRKENDNTSCKDDNRDYIKILDGWVSWSNLLLKICSMKDITGTIQSTNNKLSLRFFSDGSETFRGFNATYWPCNDSTETRKTNQVTGVVIGTGCGLVFLCLTFLALCHSRRCRLLCLQKEVEKYSDYADVVEQEGPPTYCDVMASPDKFPTTTDSTNNSEELPPYPGLPQNENMIPKASQQSLNDAGYISQEIEEDVLEKSVIDATESIGENSQNASKEPPEMSANEQEVEVSIEEAEVTNVAADDEKTTKVKVENVEFIDDDISTWDESETQDFQHPKSINTVV